MHTFANPRPFGVHKTHNGLPGYPCLLVKGKQYIRKVHKEKKDEGTQQWLEYPAQDIRTKFILLFPLKRAVKILPLVVPRDIPDLCPHTYYYFFCEGTYKESSFIERRLISSQFYCYAFPII